MKERIAPLTAALRGLWEDLLRPAAADGGRHGGHRYWQERILRALLTVGLVLGVVIYAVFVWMAIRERLLGVALLNTGALILGGYLVFSRRLTYRRRARITLVLNYAVGLYITSYFGLLSGGPAWLFLVAVLAALLLDLRAAVLAVAVNGATLAVLGLLFQAGVIGQGLPFFPTLARAVNAYANFLLLNAVAAVAVAVMVRGLKENADRATASRTEAEAEREALIAARTRLKTEVEARRETEAALRRSEERYRRMAENIQDVIWSMDLEMCYTYISPAARRVHGWSDEQLERLTVERVLTPESLEKAAVLLAAHLADGEATGDYHRTETLELEMYRSDGSTLWTEVTAAFLLGDDGRPEGFLGVTRDITERRREREEKEALRAALERSKKMEAMGMLAGGVAHDLNNILSGLVSYPELLLMDVGADSPMRKPLETIQSSGQRAAAIVADLLTVARRVASEREVHRLNAVVEAYLAGHALHQLRGRYPAVRVETALAPDLLNLRCSRVHIEKALMNLVTNAMEAIGGPGRVHVSTANRYLEAAPAGHPGAVPGEYVVLGVADDGPGISREDRERIFEPFYTRKVMGRSGTGLGLAVVWNTVQEHGGFIDVESGPTGTRFTVWLPATRQAAADDPDACETVVCDGNGQLVLVVDDEEAQRQIAADMLRRLGYRAATVASGAEALAWLAEHTADLVLLDMVMPRMDGLATYRRIRERHPGQAALIASGYAATENVREAQRLGAGAYLRKPYTLRQLSEHVRRELSACG